MVSVDPERDTAKNWGVRRPFQSGFVGLTGSETEIAAVAKGLASAMPSRRSVLRLVTGRSHRQHADLNSAGNPRDLAMRSNLSKRRLI